MEQDPNEFSDGLPLPAKEPPTEPPEAEGGPSANKNKKKRKFIVLLCVLLFFVILGGSVGIGYSVLKKKADRLTNQLGAYSVSPQEFGEKFDSLGAIGKSLFLQKLQAAFVKTVKADPYTRYTDDGYTLIYMDRIEVYRRYQAIAKTLGMTKELSNVCDYIDAVMGIESYKAYNGISKVVHTCLSDVSDATHYAGESYDFTLSKFKEKYFGFAHRSMQKALSTAKLMSDGSSYCLLYVNALEDVDDYFYSQSLYYSDSKTASAAYTSALDTISEVLSKVTTATNEVAEKIEAFPAIDDFE